MVASKRSSMEDSTREPQEENGSSDYEKRQESAMDIDEEKAIGLDGTAPREEEVESITQQSSRHRPSHDDRSLKTVRSHHSRAGGDGYTCFDADPSEHRPNKSKSGGVVTEEPYLVSWDGDADPLNPRSMTKLRRWAIVFICAASSLCVCVIIFSLRPTE